MFSGIRGDDTKEMADLVRRQLFPNLNLDDHTRIQIGGINDAVCIALWARQITALHRTIDWQIAGKRGQIKKMKEGPEKERCKAVEKAKASIRAFVEHPFHIIKNIFRHRKVRYRGLAKNGHQLHTLFGLANLVIGARRRAA